MTAMTTISSTTPLESAPAGMLLILPARDCTSLSVIAATRSFALAGSRPRACSLRNLVRRPDHQHHQQAAECSCPSGFHVRSYRVFLKFDPDGLPPPPAAAVHAAAYLRRWAKSKCCKASLPGDRETSCASSPSYEPAARRRDSPTNAVPTAQPRLCSHYGFHSWHVRCSTRGDEPERAEAQGRNLRAWPVPARLRDRGTGARRHRRHHLQGHLARRLGRACFRAQPVGGRSLARLADLDRGAGVVFARLELAPLPQPLFRFAGAQLRRGGDPVSGPADAPRKLLADDRKIASSPGPVLIPLRRALFFSCRIRPRSAP